jgi:mycothiol synthase
MEIRRPRFEDAHAVVTIINGCTVDDIGMAVLTLDELDPERLEDFEVAVERGRVEAVLEFATDREVPELYFEGFVAPGARGRGLGTMLVERAGLRAQELATDTGRNARLLTNVMSDGARKIVEAAGYRQVRFEYAMWMDLSHEAIREVTVEGLEVVPYVEGRDDRAMWKVMREGLGDDWEEGRPTEMEPWIESHKEPPAYEASLWFLAYSDGRLVGGIMGRSWWGAQHDVGHVKNLAVLPRERRGGVGRALLLHLATTFRGRGKRAMVLGVDGDNATRARAFYERVGMNARAATYDYAKEVAPP